MFWNKNYWKEGLSDKWLIEKSSEWNGWIWTRKDKSGTVVGRSYRAFVRPEWALNHASALGKNGDRKELSWQIANIGGWRWIAFRDNEVFQKSHTHWPTKKLCVANAERHGYIK